jgi:hypothetical protein
MPAGKGLNGYAALAGYLEKRGYAVAARKRPPRLTPALLVLTPPQSADGKALIETVVEERAICAGPTWSSRRSGSRRAGAGADWQGASEGWVQLAGPRPPSMGRLSRRCHRRSRPCAGRLAGLLAGRQG